MNPPLLKLGDKVGIIATAGQLDFNKIQPAIERIVRWGLIPVVAPSVKSQYGYFAGEDEIRRRDLQAMLDDEAIKAIFCARGGYGTTRVIDQIDWAAFSQSPKWVVGFSDVTAIHSGIQPLGIASLHAPTLNVWNDEESLRHIYCALFEQPKDIVAPGNIANQLGVAQAPIVGGNLCMLAHMVGSKTALNTQGKILFIEEVGENAYAVDRLLLQLQRAGMLEHLAGLIIGDLDLTNVQEQAFGISQYQMVLEKTPSHIPVAFDFPIGHKARNLAVVSGAVASLRIETEMSVLAFMPKIMHCQQ